MTSSKSAKTCFTDFGKVPDDSSISCPASSTRYVVSLRFRPFFACRAERLFSPTLAERTGIMHGLFPSIARVPVLGITLVLVSRKNSNPRITLKSSITTIEKWAPSTKVRLESLKLIQSRSSCWFLLSWS